MTNLELMVLLENIRKTADVNETLALQIEKAINDLKISEAAKENKAAGNKEVAAAAKKLAKWCDTKKNSCLGLTKKDEKNYICDGYQMMEFSKDVNTEGIQEAATPLNNPVSMFNSLNEASVEIPLPEIIDLKKFIAETKPINRERKKDGQNKIPFILPGQIGVNPEFLLNAINATGASVAVTKGSPKDLIFLTGNGVRYLILPVNINRAAAAA